MNKTILLPVLMIFSFSMAIAQPKGDYTWVLGYPPNDSTQGYGGTILNFASGHVEAKYFDSHLFINNSAQICGNNGFTIFYSNGCKVMNFEHKTIHDSEGLNPGELYDFWCETNEVACRTHQGLIALPWPD